MKKILTTITIVLICLQVYGENGFLGVTTRTLSDREYEENNLSHGLLIQHIVQGSSAEKNNLQKGDILLTVNREKLYTTNQLSKMLSFTKPKDKIKLGYLKEGKKKSIDLVLGSEYDRFPKRAYVGVFLKEISRKHAENGTISMKDYIEIDKVIEDSPADKAGVKDGDILLKMNNEKIYTIDQFTKMLKSYQKGDTVTLLVSRKEKDKKIKIVLDEKIESNLMTLNIGKEPNNLFIMKSDKVSGKYLGIQGRSVQKEDDKKIDDGVIILSVSNDSPAKKAGLKEKDIIIEFNNKKIKSMHDLKREIKNSDADKDIKVVLYRNGKKVKKIVILEDNRYNIDIEINSDIFKIDSNGHIFEFDFDNLDKLDELDFFQDLEDLKDLEKLEKLKKLDKLEEIKKIKVIESSDDDMVNAAWNQQANYDH